MHMHRLIIQGVSAFMPSVSTVSGIYQLCRVVSRRRSEVKMALLDYPAEIRSPILEHVDVLEDFSTCSTIRVVMA